MMKLVCKEEPGTGSDTDMISPLYADVLVKARQFVLFLLLKLSRLKVSPLKLKQQQF